MFKKILVLFAIAITLTFAFINNNKPVFNGFSDKFTVYSESNSSNAEITQANAFNYCFINNKTGESFSTEKGKIDVDGLLKEFDAKTVFTETTEYGESIYAYSSKIKYCKSIDGKKVNIQVFTGEKDVTVGSPVIFGSF